MKATPIIQIRAGRERWTRPPGPAAQAARSSRPSAAGAIQFGTQPLPGMNSRLPEWVLQPADNNVARSNRIKQSFNMESI